MIEKKLYDAGYAKELARAGMLCNVEGAEELYEAAKRRISDLLELEEYPCDLIDNVELGAIDAREHLLFWHTSIYRKVYGEP